MGVELVGVGVGLVGVGEAAYERSGTRAVRRTCSRTDTCRACRRPTRAATDVLRAADGRGEGLQVAALRQRLQQQALVRDRLPGR